MISHQILGCLFLILLSQYGDAWKSRYVESILNSLQHIENLLIKQAEQHTLNCIIPAEKLFDLISELSKSSNNESNEAQSGKYLAPLNPDNILILRKTLDLDDEKDSEEIAPRIQRQRNKNKNRNENANINTNANTNTLHARRALDGGMSHQLNKDRNRNVNYNVNTNVNKNTDLDLDLSEDEN